MIEEIRELFQNFIAPQLESIKGDIKALDARIEGFRRELMGEIRRVEKVLSADFVRLEEKVDLRLANMDTQLASTNAIMDARLEAMNERLDLYRPKSIQGLKPQRTSRKTGRR